MCPFWNVSWLYSYLVVLIYDWSQFSQLLTYNKKCTVKPFWISMNGIGSISPLPNTFWTSSNIQTFAFASRPNWMGKLRYTNLRPSFKVCDTNLSFIMFPHWWGYIDIVSKSLIISEVTKRFLLVIFFTCCSRRLYVSVSRPKGLMKFFVFWVETLNKM